MPNTRKKKSITYQSRTEQHHGHRMPRTTWSTSSARNLPKLPKTSEDAWRNCSIADILVVVYVSNKNSRAEVGQDKQLYIFYKSYY